MISRFLTVTEKILDASLMGIPLALTFSRGLVETLSVILILCWIILHVFRRTWPRKSFLFVALTTYWAAGLLSLFASEFVWNSLKEFLNVIQYSCVALIACERLQDRKNLTRFVWIIAAASFVIACDALFQLVFGFDFIRFQPPMMIGDSVRIRASFSHSNNLAAYLAMSIPVVLSLAYERCPARMSGSTAGGSHPRTLRNSLEGAAHAIVLILLFTALIFTYSRGAWLGLGVALCIYALRRDLRLLAFFAVVIAVSIFFLPDTLIMRFKDIFNIHNITTQMRFSLWIEGWEIFKRSPVIGHGLKSFSLMLGKGYTHNCYLQMLVETGVLGLAAFLWVLAYSSSRTIVSKIHGLSLGFGCAVLAGAVHAFSDAILYSIPTATFFWLLLGAGLSFHRQAQPAGSDKNLNAS